MPKFTVNWSVEVEAPGANEAAALGVLTLLSSATMIPVGMSFFRVTDSAGKSTNVDFKKLANDEAYMSEISLELEQIGDLHNNPGHPSSRPDTIEPIEYLWTILKNMDLRTH